MTTDQQHQCKSAHALAIIAQLESNHPDLKCKADHSSGSVAQRHKRAARSIRKKPAPVPKPAMAFSLSYLSALKRNAVRTGNRAKAKEIDVFIREIVSWECK